MIQEIAISRVFMRKDARKIDEVAVRRLVDSIGELGIINPLRVRAAVRMVNGVEGEAYETIAGNHRLKAAIKAGLETVPCIVVDDDDLRAELAMIDENLMRAELSAADRAEQTARRKAIYEELHPETKHGGDRKTDQVANLATPNFVKETASCVGKSERVIQRDAERGEKISEEALRLVKGTRLDKGKDLDDLKKVPREKQVAWVERRLKEPAPAKKTKVAADPLGDAEACERQVARLMDAWNAAGPEAREEFLLRIDAPVFDRGRGSVIAFHVPGEPVAKGRPRFVRATGRTFTPAKTASYEGDRCWRCIKGDERAEAALIGLAGLLLERKVAA
jgi:ParB-like chromosome segregation protein Spo0J